MLNGLWCFALGKVWPYFFLVVRKRTRWRLYGAASLVKGGATEYKFLSVNAIHDATILSLATYPNLAQNSGERQGGLA